MTLLYTAVLAVLLVAFGLFLYRSVESPLVASLTQALHARFNQALAAAPAIMTDLRRSRPAAGPRRFSALESLAGPGLFLQIRDRAGRVVAASCNLQGQVLPPLHGAPAESGHGQDVQIRLPAVPLVPEAAGSDITQARFAVRSGPVCDAHGQVVGLLQVAQSLFVVDEVQDKLVDVLLQGMVVALAVAVLAGLWLAGQLLRPIARLTDTARRIAASGDLSHRITVPPRARHDEVGQLAATFNAMLERLDRAFTAQRRFVADAGHEFKTPLTAILGQANLLRRRGKEHPELVDEATTAIIEQAERLHRLTRALLDLARLDEGPALAREVVSLGQIAAHVVAELTPLAGEKTIQLTATGPTGGSTLVQGDLDKLEQLVVNLVDNALKFAPPGGHVRVTARHDATGRTPTVVLEVQDTGCGIAATDLPHIFERFYRVDRARSRAAGGMGLGLAIVHEVARCHGGTVEVESQPRQGSLLRVRFPAVVADGTRA